MGRQCYWVLRTYLANKLFLVMLAFTGFMFAVIVGSSFSRKVSLRSDVPQEPRGGLRVYSVNSLEDVRRMHLENEVDELDLGRLWWDLDAKSQGPDGGTPRVVRPADVAAPYDVLSEFPNLRYVRLNDPGSRVGVTRVADPQQVQYLAVGALQDLSSLSSFRNLERLDFLWRETPRGIETLATLPKLKTLRIGSDAFLDNAALAEIARLPHLECLIISSSVRDPLTTQAALAELRAAPRLREFYLGPPWGPPNSKLLAEARAALPNVDVQPVADIAPMPWFLGVTPAILAGAVGGILARQFRNPASHLSAGFLRAHALVGLLWLGIIVAGVLVSTWSAGRPLLPGLMFALGMTGCLFGGGVDLAKRSYLGPRMEFSLLDKLLGLSLLVVLPLLVIPVFGHLSGLSQSVQTGLALIEATLIPALLLVGMGYLWRACLELQTLAGATSPFGMGRAATSFQSSATFAEITIESFLASWKSPAHKATLWNRVLRWRVGNPRTRSVVLILFGSLGMAIFLFIPRLAGSQSWLPLRLGVYPTFMLFIASFQIAATWRKRLTCLDVESLRPTHRAPLQREWAISLAWDLLPPALTTAAIATLSFQLRDEWLSSFAWQALIAGWAEALSMLIVLTGALWLAALAFTCIIVVIERPWLGLAIAFGVFFLGGIPFGALLGSLARRLHFASDPGAAMPLLLIPATVSAVVIVCMWRFWTRIDFDRRS